MPRIISASLLILLVLVPVGCTSSADNDEEEIQTLLNSSQYTDENHSRSYGSLDSTPTPGLPSAPITDNGTIPFVRFRRYIPPGGVSRTIEVNIPAYPGYPDTTALATITSEITGELRTFFDTTSNPILIWRKPVHDEGLRRVYLTKHENQWRIRRMSPLRFRTLDAAYELAITEIKAHANSWPEADTFRLATTDTLLAKEDLPSFVPNDTVTVWVKVTSTGDSCWVFLHHGRRTWPHRWRQPYLKTSTTTFERTWHIGGEGYERPEVRPSGHDAIGWNSLWADSSEPYVAAAWAIPYVVRAPGEQIPEE